MPAIVSRVVEVVVFRVEETGARVLLLRRASGERVHPGIWQIITGTIEAGESAVRTALREITEETGLTPEKFWAVPFVNQFYDPGKDEVHLIPFFAARVPPEADAWLSPEHSESRWLSFPEAGRMLIWPGQRDGLEIVRREIVEGGEASMRTLVRI